MVEMTGISDDPLHVLERAVEAYVGAHVIGREAAVQLEAVNRAVTEAQRLATELRSRAAKAQDAADRVRQLLEFISNP